MSIRDKILIAEDEAGIARFIRTILQANGYDVITARTGTETCSMISSHCPDLLLLDLGLPDMDGMEVIRQVRQWSSLPIIVVSARSYEYDKVRALDNGADDYITKPFGSAELLARVRVAIRHRNTGSGDNALPAEGQIRIKDMEIDCRKYQVTIGGQRVHLTQNEYKIVSLLARHAGRVLTYDYIMKEIWGPQSRGGNQILRVNMANIRRKMEANPAEPEYIFTEIGVGYRMADDAGEEEDAVKKS